MKNRKLAVLAGLALSVGLGLAQAEMKSDKMMDDKKMKSEK